MAFDFPINPTEGQQFQPVGQDMRYIYRDPYWEIFAAAAGGLGEAPTDGQNYARNGQVGAWLVVDKNMVGLGSVDNTSDAAKPISTATIAALNTKENIITPSTSQYVWDGTKNWVTMMSLPVSTAMQTALNLKANIASPALTGTPIAPTANPGTNTTQIATTQFVTSAITASVPPSNSAPLMNGVAAAGTSIFYTRADHVHPRDSTKLDLAGGAMSGFIQLHSDPTVYGHAATKGYADSVATWAYNRAETKMPIAGGAFTGRVVAPTAGSGMATPSGSYGAFEVQSAGGGGAFMSFHRLGQYAVYFGLDMDNALKVGGWSMGAAAYTIWTTANLNPANYLPVWGGTLSGMLYANGAISIHNTAPQINMYDTDWGPRYIHCNDGNIGFLTSTGAWGCYSDNGGNFVATGNVGGFSDARLKDDIVTIEDALSIVRKLRGVYFTRNDTGQLGTGCIAQEVLPWFPRVVAEDANGIYNLAYGNMVGLLIEAIKILSGAVDHLHMRMPGNVPLYSLADQPALPGIS